MADNTADKLQSIINNPEIMDLFSKLINSDGEKESQSQDETDIALEAKNLVSRINSGNDKRINLLNALRPYMRQSRASSIDKAVKMLKLTQLGSIFKDL